MHRPVVPFLFYIEARVNPPRLTSVKAGPMALGHNTGVNIGTFHD
jgi:hypothetical protein